MKRNIIVRLLTRFLVFIAKGSAFPGLCIESKRIVIIQLCFFCDDNDDKICNKRRENHALFFEYKEKFLISNVKVARIFFKMENGMIQG